MSSEDKHKKVSDKDSFGSLQSKLTCGRKKTCLHDPTPRLDKASK